MTNRNNQIGIGIETRAGKGRVGRRKEWKGWGKDGRGKVRGMVSTWHSVGPRGNYQEARVRDSGSPGTEEGMRMKGKSQCQERPGKTV